MRNFLSQFESARRSSRLKYIPDISVRQGDQENLCIVILDDIQFNVYVDRRDESGMCFLQVDSEEDGEIPAYIAYRSFGMDPYNKLETDVDMKSILIQISTIIDAIKKEGRAAISRMTYFCRGYELGYNEGMSA